MVAGGSWFSLKIQGGGGGISEEDGGGGLHRCREDVCREGGGAKYFFQGRNSHKGVLGSAHESSSQVLGAHLSCCVPRPTILRHPPKIDVSESIIAIIDVRIADRGFGRLRADL